MLQLAKMYREGVSGVSIAVLCVCVCVCVVEGSAPAHTKTPRLIS